MNGQTKITIAFFVVCMLLVICLSWGLWDHFGSDKKYRELLTKHNETIGEVGNLTKKLDDTNREFEKYKYETDRIVSELTGTIDRSREVIRILQNVGSEIEGANQEIAESIVGIKQILKEIMAGDN